MAKLVQLTSPDILRTRMLSNRYKTPQTRSAYLKATAEHLRKEADRLDREAAELNQD